MVANANCDQLLNILLMTQLIIATTTTISIIEAYKQSDHNLSSIKYDSFVPRGREFISSNSRVRRIVNGRNTDISIHPWAVRLELDDPKNSGSRFCGGAILRDDLIVTAKHCVNGTKGGKILYGSSKRSATNPSSISFSEKDDVTYHNQSFVDICLISLPTKIQLGVTAKPIGLPPNASSEPKAGDQLTISGWGYACEDPPTCNNQSRLPEYIQEINLTRKDDSCVTDNLVKSTGFGSEQKATLMCAGGDGQHGGKIGSCEGDSGGPVECSAQNGNVYLCGIIAVDPVRPNCGVNPTAITKISVPEVYYFLESGGNLSKKVPDRPLAFKLRAEPLQINLCSILVAQLMLVYYLN
ncbi:trypsin beta-like isoform X2 [Convolutriloba macropyga]|uniref:trypsin beta-like isoform X2 n=1 Tax=Convolutriloba macropyga TaxID=536237 RepID=UPI003F51D6B3